MSLQTHTRPIAGTPEAFDPTMFGDRADAIVALGANHDGGKTTIRAHILDTTDEIGRVNMTPADLSDGNLSRASACRIDGKTATTILVAAALLAIGMDYVRAFARAAANLFGKDAKLLGSPFTSFGAASSERTTKIVVSYDGETMVIPDVPGIDHDADTLDQVDTASGLKIAGTIGKSTLFGFNLLRQLLQRSEESWTTWEIPAVFGGFLGILKTTGEKIVIATTRGYYIPVIVNGPVVTIDTLSAFELDEGTIEKLHLVENEYVSGPSPIGVTVVGYTEDGAKYVRNVPVSDILGTSLAYLFTQLYSPNWLEATALPAIVAATKKAFEPIEA